MEARTRKLRLLQGARRPARAQWAAPAGAPGLLPAGFASPKLWIRRLRSAWHMLPSSDRGRSTLRYAGSEFTIPDPASAQYSPEGAPPAGARARAGGEGRGGAARRVRDGSPLRVWVRTRARA